MATVTLLTEEQAAEYAGVSRKTIRRLIESGRLEASDYGTGKRRHYRIHPDALTHIKPVPAPPLPQPRRRRAGAMPASLIHLFPRVDGR